MWVKGKGLIKKKPSGGPKIVRGGMGMKSFLVIIDNQSGRKID